MKYIKLQISLVILLISVVSFSQEQIKRPVLEDDDFIVIDNLSEFKNYISKDNVKVRLKKGNYQIDKALCTRFIIV